MVVSKGSGYESFLLNNVSAMSTLESSLRSLTWFLPGRFKDAELASEARQFTCSHFFGQPDFFGSSRSLPQSRQHVPRYITRKGRSE
jgi:hypothetical protein